MLNDTKTTNQIRLFFTLNRQTWYEITVNYTFTVYGDHKIACSFGAADLLNVCCRLYTDSLWQSDFTKPNARATETVACWHQ